ncbi:hypothetical protein [Kribbella antibiotica]|uniref:hypothetical protein n=1 Tax=Kribbella antibiotica TaxID=190195 RepID=UPI0014053BC3|nr:hypothetical protein [Kribbella antibiotica]
MTDTLVQPGVGSRHLTDQAGRPTKILVSTPGKYIRVQAVGTGVLSPAEVVVRGV